jgi:multiple sugar transport system permease protein
MPYGVPGVIAALLWGFLYIPATSPVLQSLGAVGIDIDPLSSDAVLFAIANIALWGFAGYNMLILIAALDAIPSELYEAARLDGAGELAIALRIKIPMVRPALVLTFFFSLIATLQVYSEPTTLKPLTNGLSSTWSPLMKVYRDAFTRGDVYSASATSVVIAVVTLVLSFGFLKLAGRRAYGEQ